MEPKLSEESLIETFKKENDRSVNILLQLSNLQTRFSGFESKLAELIIQIAEWRKDSQSMSLKMQSLEQRVEVLEKTNSNRSSKEWELFKMALPHIITLTIVGFVVKFGLK